ncbi:MAG: protein BatD, partial [Granulosicoccus sp.]|nr:protein BatD [Granulosicoccus sp.]
MRLNPGNCIAQLWSTVRRPRLLLMLLVWLSLPVWAQQGTVRSELSASTISRDESVTLTIVAQGIDGELDISALDKDFEVVGRSSSRQISTVTAANGQPTTTSIVSWALELLPRDVGVFTVPAVSVGGVPSQLLSLTVNELPVGASRDIFIEATVDTRTPWVQSQVLMTLRVFQAVEIVDGGLSEPGGEHLEVQRIGEDTRSTETRDGRQYSVTERRFALFPQQSGTLVVEPVTLNISVPADPSRVRGFFSPTRKLTRRTDAITLDVQTRPPAGASWWLPASAVVLDAQWAGGDPVAKVDQPMTRSVVLRAAGVMDSQLPDISIPAIEGVSLYAEEPVRAMGVNERGLVAEQTVKWALIPQRTGALVLPEVRVEWFNTTTGNVETAVLPEEII